MAIIIILNIRNTKNTYHHIYIIEKNILALKLYLCSYQKNFLINFLVLFHVKDDNHKY